MAKIDQGNQVRRARIRRNVQPPPPKPRVQKTQVQQEKPLAKNANTVRNDAQNYGDQQKARLNSQLNQNEQNNSALIGGTSGSTSGQFAQSESNVRNTGRITIPNDPNMPNDFVDNVRTDLNAIAPGTRVNTRPNDPIGGFIWDNWVGKNTAAVVKPADSFSRVQGHETGYRLVDQLQNNPNEVTLNYQANDAYAAPRTLDGIGSVTNPGSGSAVDVHYDPKLNVGLPVQDTNGNLTNAPSNSAIILGHELSHASHMQRGTQQNVRPITSMNELGSIWGTQGKENVFSSNGKSYVEADNPQIGLREEYRNVGFEGHTYGNEPSENSLRRELNIPERRVSYQFDNSYQQITNTQANLLRTQNRLMTTTDAVVDGVRGSRNSALISAGFSTVTAIAQGKDLQGVTTDAVIGATTGVTEEVIERVVNGPRAATTGMTNNASQVARSTMKGAAVAGAVVNTAFAVHDQWDNLQNDATLSQAIGTIAGEAVVGAASGAAGAYAGAMAGAAIGSVVPGVGTVIGGVVGFAVGAGAGYLADRGLRGIGVDRMVSSAVTATYDAVSNVASNVSDAVSNTVSEIGEGARNMFGGAVNRLSSIFGG